MKQEIYRLRLPGVPTATATVQVRSAGFYQTEPGWRDPPLNKSFLELFWCLSGEIAFGDETASYRLKPKEVCCYFPGDLHLIQTDCDAEYYWITFDGSELDALIRSFHLTREPRRAGFCPAGLFQRLFRELREPGVGGEARASLTGYEILLHSAHDSDDHEQTLGERFRRAVGKQFRDPAFNIATLADELGVHRSTLMRQIRAEFGMAPQQYLESLRLQNAVNLLQNSTMKIKEIAADSGFNDPNYFCKAFRKKIGKSPSEIR